MTDGMTDAATDAMKDGRTPDLSAGWAELDRRAVDTCRVLAMDAVERVGNGHPGTAMSLAPAAYLLFQRHLRHDPADPHWGGRDRFVLSMGHSSLTLYLQLYLSGYGLELDDLKALRTWGSRTPAHPEWGHTAGVETTTGPLGQGLANGVGMALAQRRVRGLLDPDAASGSSPFDWTVWVFASDGDMQEGISAEASSLAGTQRLGNLAVVWDDNRISIEDDTKSPSPRTSAPGTAPTAGASSRSIWPRMEISTSSPSTRPSPKPESIPNGRRSFDSVRRSPGRRHTRPTPAPPTVQHWALTKSPPPSAFSGSPTTPPSR